MTQFKFAFVALALPFALAACGGGYYQRSAEADYLDSRGEALEDAALTSKVAALITEDTTLRGSEIRVRTFGNRVNLDGFVRSPGDRRHAEGLAYSVPGVADVDNDLEVNY